MHYWLKSRLPTKSILKIFYPTHVRSAQADKHQNGTQEFLDSIPTVDNFFFAEVIFLKFYWCV